MSRTKKKPLRGSKAFDRTCRNHGGCPWCLGNRLHKNKCNAPIDEKGKEIP